jgi:hypothetical protein
MRPLLADLPDGRSAMLHEVIVQGGNEMFAELVAGASGAPWPADIARHKSASPFVPLVRNFMVAEGEQLGLRGWFK